MITAFLIGTLLFLAAFYDKYLYYSQILRE